MIRRQSSSPANVGVNGGAILGNGMECAPWGGQQVLYISTGSWF